jgi:hypothetical protein
MSCGSPPRYAAAVEIVFAEIRRGRELEADLERSGKVSVLPLKGIHDAADCAPSWTLRAGEPRS